MSQDTKDDDLFGRTWKTVVVLVGVCVLFVGALSATAVLVASRAVAPPTHTSDTSDSTVAAPPAIGAKKPLAI